MIYVHVPFCASRCIYCDFYSTTLSAAVKEQYTLAACNELIQRIGYLPTSSIKSVYLGGGTPSQLSLSQLERLLSCIHANYQVSQHAEITLECNPDDINEAFVKAIKSLGINRVSLGVQSFDDQILKLLNRRHNALGAVEAVNTLQANGIVNLSIDLIYGLPLQTIQSFKNDLIKAFSLPITHLSSYALSVEKSTVLSKKIACKELTLPNDKTFASEYNLLMEEAKKHGFEHYEISNFSLKGYASQHNSGYWDGTPYLGIGPGAHSFNGTTRRYNIPNLVEYIKQSKNNQFPHQTEHLSTAERYNELVFTSLRTKRGLSLAHVERLFGKSQLNYLLSNAQTHINSGRLLLSADYLTLSPNHIFVSDDIISDLMIGE